MTDETRTQVAPSTPTSNTTDGSGASAGDSAGTSVGSGSGADPEVAARTKTGAAAGTQRPTSEVGTVAQSPAGVERAAAESRNVTPGVAAVPGKMPSGGTQAAKPERKEKRAGEGGGTHQQLQNAYADLMTPEEMAAHRAKVKKTRTYAECKTLFESTGKDMEARAKAQNKTIGATPTEICDKAKERGRLTG
jgi:hypothetical protein